MKITVIPTFPKLTNGNSRYLLNPPFTSQVPKFNSRAIYPFVDTSNIITGLSLQNTGTLVLNLLVQITIYRLNVPFNLRVGVVYRYNFNPVTDPSSPRDF